MSRKPLVESPEEFLTRVEAYFEDCKEHKEPATYTGMLIALGFHSRQNMYDYSRRTEYTELVLYAKLRIESVYEANLHGPNPTGSIFALKNMGWSDKQVHEMKGAVEIKDNGERAARVMALLKKAAEKREQQGNAE